VSGEEGKVAVAIFDAEGRLLATYEVAIASFGQAQIPILGGIGGTQVDAARATVTVISGAARVVAYGSVVDNVSGDPIYVPARRPDTLLQVVPAAFRVDGDRNTHWRSDLWLANPSSTATIAEVAFRDSNGALVAESPVPVAGGATVALRDVIASPLGLATAAGSLAISSDRPLLATTRSWTPGARGTFGQLVPALDTARSIGAGDAPAHAIQIESSEAFRTNAGAVETTGANVVVRVRLFDAAGTQLVSKDVPMAPFGQMQFNVANEGAPAFGNGRASFEVVSGSGRILAYASVVDNLSGDPVYISAE
jgi:hypothetical protein